MRELDFSRIWLRINANDSSKDRDDVVAEFKCDTKEFLEQCYVSSASIPFENGEAKSSLYHQNGPADFQLAQADGSNKSVIRMTARYVPVDITLEPRESINSGSLTCSHAGDES